MHNIIVASELRRFFFLKPSLKHTKIFLMDENETEIQKINKGAFFLFESTSMNFKM